MTISDVIVLALRQLDEDPADVSEYEDLFRRYANEGCQIILRDVYKPRKTLSIETGADGRIDLAALGASRVVSVRDESGRELAHLLSADGASILTGEKSRRVRVLAETDCAAPLGPMDTPAFPAWAHGVLADYICYRHLSAGGPAKQGRAQFFLGQFYQNMRRIRAQGEGSVTRLRHLYDATDLRCAHEN